MFLNVNCIGKPYQTLPNFNKLNKRLGKILFISNIGSEIEKFYGFSNIIDV